MRAWRQKLTGQTWRAAALIGLITGSFSTLISQLAAARMGRNAAVDWMVVATIPIRDYALQTDPSWGVILNGILFHQWADFSWALVFFGLLSRWTAGLTPLTLLLIAIPWGFFTSAVEWLFLVPLVPFWQPIFTLEQAYWLGLLVHLASASLYPLYPGVRDWIAGQTPSPHRRFTIGWSGLAVMGLSGLGILALMGWSGRELPWVGREPGFDQSFMGNMTAHHAQGIAIAQIATERSKDPHLRDISKLMVAAQKGEIAVFRQWWESWFRGSLADQPALHSMMQGMLTPAQVQSLRDAARADFDALFVSLMTKHHQGAIAMADEAMRRAADPRLKIMAHAIRHEQSGEIEMMRGTEGAEAVKAALASLLKPPANGPPRAIPQSHSSERQVSP